MPESRPSTQIRLVRPGEDAGLRNVRLNALACAPHLAEHFEKESTAPSSFWHDRAERGAAGARMATFVAVDGGEFIGVVDGFLSDDGGTAEIGGMWVRPTSRCSGIGRDLLEAVCNWARTRGAVRAVLWVRQANTPALLLYERSGFELARTSEVAGETGLRLERSL
ncbi:MAG: GNAT family N-acetyltransferase [Gaiellaceae bacterium]